jgi:hypothetical protein
MDSLYERVRSILLTDWDPIGIQDVPQASDEYDQYVNALAKMVIARTPAPELSKRLLEIETQAMGLAGNRDRARAVADKLAKIASSN